MNFESPNLEEKNKSQGIEDFEEKILSVEDKIEQIENVPSHLKHDRLVELLEEKKKLEALKEDLLKSEESVSREIEEPTESTEEKISREIEEPTGSTEEKMSREIEEPTGSTEKDAFRENSDVKKQEAFQEDESDALPEEESSKLEKIDQGLNEYTEGSEKETENDKMYIEKIDQLYKEREGFIKEYNNKKTNTIKLNILKDIYYTEEFIYFLEWAKGQGKPFEKIDENYDKYLVYLEKGGEDLPLKEPTDEQLEEIASRINLKNNVENDLEKELEETEKEINELPLEKRGLFERLKKDRELQKKIIIGCIALGVGVTIPACSIALGGGFMGAIGVGSSVPILEAVGLGAHSVAIGGPLSGVLLFKSSEMLMNRIFKKKEDLRENDIEEGLEKKGITEKLKGIGGKIRNLRTKKEKKVVASGTERTWGNS